MKRPNKINEAIAIVKQTRVSLNRLSRLKLSVSDQGEISHDLCRVYETLQFLQIGLETIKQGEQK